MTDGMLQVAHHYAKLITSHIVLSDSMIPMFSCVTGQKILSPNELDVTYWHKTIASIVFFYQSINAMIGNEKKGRVIVEVGPQSLLSGLLNQIFDGSGQKSLLGYIPTLQKDKDPMESLLFMAGELFQYHVSLDFAAINGRGKILTDLPLYPWQHDKRYWYESRISREWRQAEFPPHPLLGSRLPESTMVEPSWRNRLH